MKRAFFCGIVASLLLGSGASAHVGSPDVYYQGVAGPYRLFVTVRAPQMIPGIAHIEAQVLDGRVSDIQIVPLRIVGEGSEAAPPPDHMEQSKSDPQFFTGKLWLMESGSFQVRMEIDPSHAKIHRRHAKRFDGFACPELHCHLWRGDARKPVGAGPSGAAGEAPQGAHRDGGNGHRHSRSSVLGKYVVDLGGKCQRPGHGL